MPAHGGSIYEENWSDEEDEDMITHDMDPDEEATNDSEIEDEDVLKNPHTGERNSHLTVGYKGSCAYVVRGKKFRIYHHSDDSSIRDYKTIGNIATPNGKSFKPEIVMLHEQDTKIILQNPTKPNYLYAMNIELGKVVEEWKVHDDINLNHITPVNKFAPTTTEQTLVGVSHNSLCYIDPRLSGPKLAVKEYASKNEFSCVTTTASGKLAVASEKGVIRLYNSVIKNAKTALTPLGDPIIGIDVTANGRYIVATTETYLAFVDTLIDQGNSRGWLGFDRSFPASSKPQPKRLYVHRADVDGKDISFTPARFNQVEGQEENAIVTSTGQFVIVWDLAQVTKGRDNYTFKKYKDCVVQDTFKFGDDNEIIVALTDDVLAVKKEDLVRKARKW